MNISRATYGLISAFALGCGVGGSNNSGDGDAGTGDDSASADDDGVTETGNTVSASASMSASAEETAAAESEDEGDDDDDGPGPVKLDVHAIPDVPIGDCQASGKGGGGNGDPDFSYIWIANSTQNTVSKIHTMTLEEEGRYLTRPDGLGNPSRTSVSLNGDVAVANRSGGVTKIYAREESCNGNNTSTGGDDILPWPDDCIAWHAPFAYASQRPVAWAPGDYNQTTCEWDNEKLWTAGANASIDILLLDGDEGEVEQLIPVPGVNSGFYGIYGGAVDADGNLWGTMLGGPSMVFVDRSNFDLTVYPMSNIGGYGMTVDEYGRPWSCSGGVAVFDPETETWATNPNVGGGGGCMLDGEGHIWIGGYSGAGGAMIGVNIDTLAVDYNIPIPNYVHGVSVDFYGFVWGVTLQQPFAYKVDIENETYETFMGLTGPYTYSDMTGWALSNAVGPAPSG